MKLSPKSIKIGFVTVALVLGSVFGLAYSNRFSEQKKPNSVSTSSSSSNSSSQNSSSSNQSSSINISSNAQNSEPNGNPDIASGTSKVKVFFGDQTKAEIECGATVAVEREINTTQSVAKEALMELFKGPNESEKVKGYYSGFVGWQEVFKSINLKPDGTIQIDLKAEVMPQRNGEEINDKYGWGTKGTSCGSGQMQQIRQTLKQFPSVKYVIFSVEGELKNPDNFYGCPEKDQQRPNSFDEQSWIELQKQCGIG